MTDPIPPLHERIRREARELAEIAETFAALTPDQRCDLRAIVMQLSACADEVRDEKGSFY